MIFYGVFSSSVLAFIRFQAVTIVLACLHSICYVIISQNVRFYTFAIQPASTRNKYLGKIVLPCFFAYTPAQVKAKKTVKIMQNFVRQAWSFLSSYLLLVSTASLWAASQLILPEPLKVGKHGKCSGEVLALKKSNAFLRVVCIHFQTTISKSRPVPIRSKIRCRTFSSEWVYGQSLFWLSNFFFFHHLFSSAYNIFLPDSKTKTSISYITLLPQFDLAFPLAQCCTQPILNVVVTDINSTWLPRFSNLCSSA